MKKQPKTMENYYCASLCIVKLTECIHGLHLVNKYNVSSLRDKICNAIGRIIDHALPRDDQHVILLRTRGNYK